MNRQEIMKRFKLTDDDMKRLKPEGIKSLIDSNEKRLTVWSLSRQDRQQIEEETRGLKELLRISEGR